MKKSFVASVIACVILTACSGQKDSPTVFTSIAPELSFTTTSTSTKTPPTNRPPTLTFTPFPFYQNKQVVFNYYVIGSHSVYDMFFELEAFREYPRLVLYDDGQIIIPRETYKQKVLSPDEIKQFLSNLEKLGFYSLESNQKHDPTDKLYDYGSNYQKSYDGLQYCILVNAEKSRNLCVYEPDIQFLIPKMKNILKYLDEYEPAETTPYYPDRILLWVLDGRDPYNDYLPETTIPWPEDLPALETFNQIRYVDGNIAKEIYMSFDTTNAGKVFTENDIEYTVYIDVILPHEKVTNANP